MKNRISILFIFSFVFLWSSCGSFLKDEKMEREVQPYKGKRIRLDGVYYSYYRVKGYDNKFKVYIFYKNGSFKHLMLDAASVDKIESSLLSVSMKKDDFLNLKTSNGAFWEVDSNTIEIRRWSAHEIYSLMFVEQIYFLSDTSFVTGKTWHIKKPEKSYVLPDTFYFRKSTFKPDSLFFEKGLDKKK